MLLCLGGGWILCTAKCLFKSTMCVRVCHYVGHVGPQTQHHHLCMSVCNLPHILYTHTHTEMRSDSVMNVSAVRPLTLHAVLCTRVCVCVRAPVCVGEVTIRAWVVTAACCLIG